MFHTRTTFSGLPEPILGPSFELDRPANEKAVRTPASGVNSGAEKTRGAKTERNRRHSPRPTVLISSQPQGASDIMPAQMGFVQLTLPPTYIWPRR